MKLLQVHCTGRTIEVNSAVFTSEMDDSRINIYNTWRLAIDPFMTKKKFLHKYEETNPKKHEVSHTTLYCLINKNEADSL